MGPIYALAGEERLLLDRALAAIAVAALGPAGMKGPSFNRDVFEVKESGLGNIVAAARTLPMFAKKRLVIAHGIDTVKADALTPLTEYAADPNPSTCLVLVGLKIDTRFKAFAGLRKLGCLYQFESLKGAVLVAWLRTEAAARKFKLGTGVAELLGETAGPDLGRLSVAMDQLSLFAGEGGEIRREHVEELIPETRERGIFELTRAIGTGDRDAALRILANMLRNKEPPLRIQYMLMRQLRQIWRAKELNAQGASKGEIAGQIGVPPFAVDEVLAPARRMTHAVLLRGYERLYEADQRLKGGSKTDPEVLVMRLVRDMAEDASG